LEWRLREREDFIGHKLEKSRNAEINGDDHHSEQEQKRMHIDGGKCLAKAEHAEGNHQNGPHKCASGTVDVQMRDLSEAD
jgi:hypothetical protein